jgi:hypothetical protein
VKALPEYNFDVCNQAIALKIPGPQASLSVMAILRQLTSRNPPQKLAIISGRAEASALLGYYGL